MSDFFSVCKTAHDHWLEINQTLNFFKPSSRKKRINHTVQGLIEGQGCLSVSYTRKTKYYVNAFCNLEYFSDIIMLCNISLNTGTDDKPSNRIPSHMCINICLLT